MDLILIAAAAFSVMLVYVNGAEYGERIKNATETWGPNLLMEESRYHGYVLPRPDHAQTELPITFQAPYINAKNYWTTPDRRTVFDYQPSFAQELFTRPITEGINTFYGFMNQFFGSEHSKDTKAPFTQQDQPYEYEFPRYRQPKPQYLPGPKPLRASVVKLEPPRHAGYFPYRISEITTQKYNPHFVKLLNDVLIENAYNNDGTFSQDSSASIKTPEYLHSNIKPTTYNPKYKLKTTTQLPFPDSIQDQLPPIKLGQDTRIPYVSETTTATQGTINTTGSRVVFPVTTESVPPLDVAIDIRSTLQPVTSTMKTFTSTTVASRNNDSERATVQPFLGINSSTEQLEDVSKITSHKESGHMKNINGQYDSHNSTSNETAAVLERDEFIVITPRTVEVVSGIQVENRNDSSNDSAAEQYETTQESMTTTTMQPFLMQSSENRPVTELLHSMEPLQKNLYHLPFPKMLQLQNPTSVDNSTDYVTELTLKGLTGPRGNKTDSVTPRSIQVVNMTIIGYSVGPSNHNNRSFDSITPRIIDFDDEYSLDAKILKDTNWDGYQPFVTVLPETTVTPEDVTTEVITTTETTTVETPLGTSESPTTISTPREDNHTAVIITHVTQTVSRLMQPRQSRKRIFSRLKTTPKYEAEARQIIENSAITEANTMPVTESTIRKGRKYHRKPRLQHFTPFPQPEDVETTTQKPLNLGTLTKPFYPKRNKPNITLSFGAKQRIDESTTDLRLNKSPRSELYKRRTFPSQLRRSMTRDVTGISSEVD